MAMLNVALLTVAMSFDPATCWLWCDRGWLRL